MYKINFDRRKNQNEKEEIVKGKEIQLLEKQKWYEKIIKKILDLFIRK